MSIFDNKSLKNITIKFTTTNECSTSNYVKSNVYLNSPSIHNDTTYDNFRYTTYDADVPPIEN